MILLGKDDDWLAAIIFFDILIKCLHHLLLSLPNYFGDVEVRGSVVRVAGLGLELLTVISFQVWEHCLDGVFEEISLSGGDEMNPSSVAKLVDSLQLESVYSNRGCPSFEECVGLINYEN